jgi:hypothetical protein
LKKLSGDTRFEMQEARVFLRARRRLQLTINV